MKKIIAYQDGRSLIVKNYSAGKRNRYNVYVLNSVQEIAFRTGCELTLGHAKRIAEKWRT